MRLSHDQVLVVAAFEEQRHHSRPGPSNQRRDAGMPGRIRDAGLAHLQMRDRAGGEGTQHPTLVLIGGLLVLALLTVTASDPAHAQRAELLARLEIRTAGELVAVLITRLSVAESAMYPVRIAATIASFVFLPSFLHIL